MKVESQAGKFILSFEKMEPGADQVVITGKMGVWDARTYVSLPEFLGILRLTLTPRMLWFLLKALVTGAMFRRGES
jgi:hypothetical protein